MKILKTLFVSVVFLLFMSHLTYAQDANKYLTLRCDIQALQDGEAPYLACQFTVQEPDTDTREFTTEVNVGDTILWEGVSSDESGEIDIMKIKYAGGTNVFDKDELDGTTTVSGRVRRNTKNKPDYKYIISFKINGTGKMYSIDPKIIVGGD